MADSPADLEPECWAIVVAAGSGRRFGSAKQYAELGGRRVLDWALDAARQACRGLTLVVPPGEEHRVEPAADVVVVGGTTRAASVRAGLATVPASAEVVVIHDGARPLAGSDLFRQVVTAVVGGADAAVPGVDVVDTIRSRHGGVVDRSELIAVQTPQAFKASTLRTAHYGDPDATDDASLVEAAGGTVVVVPGDPRNAKITVPGDLASAELLLAGP